MMDLRIHRDDECGVAVDDEYGGQEPCGEAADYWAWYDGGEHEPLLHTVCVMHETDGAYQIAEVVEENERLTATLDKVRALADTASVVPIHVGAGNLVDRRRMVSADDLRAALDEGSEL